MFTRSVPFLLPLADHGWPIADCTSEGVKASLALLDLAIEGRLDLGQRAGTGGKGVRLNLGWGRLRDGLISKQVRMNIESSKLQSSFRGYCGRAGSPHSQTRWPTILGR